MYLVPTNGAETGTPFGLVTRMDAHFPGGDLKKYRQKYRHFSKRPHCWGFETLELIVPRRYSRWGRCGLEKLGLHRSNCVSATRPAYLQNCRCYLNEFSTGDILSA